MFFGAGTFRERLDAVAAQSGGDPLVAKMIAFIRVRHATVDHGDAAGRRSTRSA